MLPSLAHVIAMQALAWLLLLSLPGQSLMPLGPGRILLLLASLAIACYLAGAPCAGA